MSLFNGLIIHDAWKNLKRDVLSERKDDRELEEINREARERLEAASVDVAVTSEPLFVSREACCSNLARSLLRKACRPGAFTEKNPDFLSRRRSSSRLVLLMRENKKAM